MNIIEASSSRRQKFKNERLEEMMEAIFKGTQKMNEGETKHMMLVIFMYIHGFKTSPVQLIAPLTTHRVWPKTLEWNDDVLIW